MTEAQKRASENYHRKKIKVFPIKLILGKDDELIELIESQPNRTEFIREALRKAINK